MKNFKLMLIAVMAMLCSAAFAQKTDGKFKFEVVDASKQTVKITGFTTAATAADKAQIEIKNTIKDITDSKSPEYKIVAVDYKAFVGETAIQKVTFSGTNLETIGGEAFSGCTALKTVDFTAATKLANIAKDAFKGSIIETLDLSKTAVVDIYNLFGTTPKHDKVLWVAGDDLNAENARIAGLVGCTMASADAISADQAKAWNKTLAGALIFNTEAGAENKFTAAQAAAYNLAILGGKEAGDGLTLDEIKVYNTKVEGAFNYNNTRYVTADDEFTAIGAAVYNTEVDPEGTPVTEGDDFEAENQVKADDFNAGLEDAGAFALVAIAEAVEGEGGLTADQAAAYNSKLDGAYKAGDAFTADMATAYNATLEGSIAAAGAWKAEDAAEDAPGVKASEFNAALGFVKEGDVHYPAVTAINNDALQTVKLPATWTNFWNSINGETEAGVFENCTALKTIDWGTPAEDVEAQAISGRAFANTALESVTIPATIAYIPEYAFYDCSKLATVTFAHKAATDDAAADAFNGFGSYAFAGTAIASISFPNWMAGAAAVAEKAFADCGSLTTVSYAPAEADAAANIIHKKAFAGCNDYVTLVTNSYLKDAYTAGGAGSIPEHVKVTTDGSAAPDPVEDELTLDDVTKYKSADKYYVKYYNTTEKTVRISKDDAKVYAAYLNEGNNSLDLIRFKTKNDLYLIAPDDVVLILSDKSEIPYTTSTDPGNTSWVDPSLNPAPTTTPDFGGADPGDVNQLRITKDKTMKSSFEDGAKLGGTALATYVWVNSASGVGFQKLGLTSVKAGVMYVYAQEPADGARLNIRWLDENGNVEEEVTAIQGVATMSKKADGNIYNVAGQKVNASYKGLVIKDGKKYMEK